MNWALLATIVGILIKYGPQIINLVEEGIAVEQTIQALDPQLVPNIEKLFNELFPHLGLTQAQIVAGLAKLNKPVTGIPGYDSSGNVVEIQST